MCKTECLFIYRQQDSHHLIDPRLEAEHREYMELKFQGEEVDKKVEVYRPIVNLVHNMVNMGSLYGGDNLMMASQYRKVRFIDIGFFFLKYLCLMWKILSCQENCFLHGFTLF